MINLIQLALFCECTFDGMIVLQSTLSGRLAKSYFADHSEKNETLVTVL